MCCTHEVRVRIPSPHPDGPIVTVLAHWQDHSKDYTLHQLKQRHTHAPLGVGVHAASARNTAAAIRRNSFLKGQL